MNTKKTVGWREYVDLPDIGLCRIKAKIDTGARTSCLHAFKTEHFTKDNIDWVRFWVHPIQKNQDMVVQGEAPIIDQRVVRDSGGHEEIRDVIRTTLSLGDDAWPIEITLTNRENMSFRMLLGRTAMHHKLIVDPSLSFLLSGQEQS